VDPRRLVQDASGLGDPRGNTLSWAELGPISAEGEHRDSEVVFGFGGHVALVTADPDTGDVRVEQLAVGYDCGRAIDPAGVNGQLAGASAMGVGATLYEELRYDDEGQPLATTFMDYLLPTLAEVPEVRVAVFGNPLGARGAGEAGVIGVGAAIANALADAAGGMEGFTELPLRPEHVLAELAAGNHPPSG
jgi:CO/xanthine dehydrogenase Mo-binding subunit